MTKMALSVLVLLCSFVVRGQTSTGNINGPWHNIPAHKLYIMPYVGYGYTWGTAGRNVWQNAQVVAEYYSYSGMGNYRDNIELCRAKPTISVEAALPVGVSLGFMLGKTPSKYGNVYMEFGVETHNIGYKVSRAYDTGSETAQYVLNGTANNYSFRMSLAYVIHKFGIGVNPWVSYSDVSSRSIKLHLRDGGTDVTPYYTEEVYTRDNSEFASWRNYWVDDNYGFGVDLFMYYEPDKNIRLFTRFGVNWVVTTYETGGYINLFGYNGIQVHMLTVGVGFPIDLIKM